MDIHGLISWNPVCALRKNGTAEGLAFVACEKRAAAATSLSAVEDHESLG